MIHYQMGVLEAQFADIIWDNEPIHSAILAKKALEKFNWKKSTSYTVLKRLCDKGLFVNEKGMVSSVISKAEYCAARSENFVKETFDGSLPAFVAAFASRKKLSASEIKELRELIASYEEK